MTASLKRLAAWALLGLFVFAWPGAQAWAGQSDSLDVKITVNVPLSVEIQDDPYDFGSQAAGVTTMSTRAITIINNSTGRTCDLAIRASDTASWTLDTSAASDQFALQAIFNSVQPSHPDFGANDFLSITDQNMDATHFSGDQNGNNVLGNAGGSHTRKIWFRLQTPTSVSSQAQQTITVTITAMDAGSF